MFVLGLRRISIESFPTDIRPILFSLHNSILLRFICVDGKATYDLEAILRFLLAWKIADFQSFASTLSSMQDPEMMSAQLLMSMFNDD